LNAGDYKTKEQFASDVYLVWDNCLRYNGESNKVTKSASNLHKKFEQWLTQALNGQTPGSSVTSPNNKSKKVVDKPQGSLRACVTLVDRLTKINSDATIFKRPNDYVKRTGNDLKGVKDNLQAQTYDTVTAFGDDLRAVFANAITYYGSGTEEFMRARWMQLEMETSLLELDAKRVNNKRGGSKKSPYDDSKIIDGITQHDKNQLTSILTELKSVKDDKTPGLLFFSAFFVPVNALQFQLMDYYDYIPQPRDLDSIQVLLAHCCLLVTDTNRPLLPQ
jgi:hypothetical protein